MKLHSLPPVVITASSFVIGCLAFAQQGATTHNNGGHSLDPSVLDELRVLEQGAIQGINPILLIGNEDRLAIAKQAHDFATKLADKDNGKYAEAWRSAFKAALAAKVGATSENLIETFRHKRLDPDAFIAELRRGRSDIARNFILNGNDDEPSPFPPSVTLNPNYQNNLRKLNEQVLPSSAEIKNVADPSLRIVGGVADTYFNDCVCIGGVGDYCCTGTLIGKNVVITAGHCFPCIRVGTRVFVGRDISKAGVELTGTAYQHPGYGKSGKHNDVCAIVLTSDVEPGVLLPRQVASSVEIDTATFIRAAGYGTTNSTGTQGFGKRRYVDIPIAEANCTGQHGYGCDVGFEFVAGSTGLNIDTCKGDSGGPAYILVGDQWVLAGITSRATMNAAHACGDGGIYVRVDKFIDWIRGLPGAHF